MSDYSELQVALMIVIIGIVFGIGWQLGRESTKAILKRFMKPVTVRFKHLDGSTSTMKLSHEEANGYKKVTKFIEKEV